MNVYPEFVPFSTYPAPPDQRRQMHSLVNPRLAPTAVAFVPTQNPIQIPGHLLQRLEIEVPKPTFGHNQKFVAEGSTQPVPMDKVDPAAMALPMTTLPGARAGYKEDGDDAPDKNDPALALLELNDSAPPAAVLALLEALSPYKSANKAAKFWLLPPHILYAPKNNVRPMTRSDRVKTNRYALLKLLGNTVVRSRAIWAAIKDGNPLAMEAVARSLNRRPPKPVMPASAPQRARWSNFPDLTTPATTKTKSAGMGLRSGMRSGLASFITLVAPSPISREKPQPISWYQAHVGTRKRTKEHGALEAG